MLESNFTENEVDDIFKIVSSILNIGNIKFENAENDDFWPRLHVVKLKKHETNCFMDQYTLFVWWLKLLHVSKSYKKLSFLSNFNFTSVCSIL